MPKPNLNPPPYQIQNTSDTSWRKWFDRVFVRFGNGNGAFPVRGIDKADLPDASNHGDDTVGSSYTSILFVPDATGGACLAFSDGTDWISTVTGSAV